MLFKLSLSLLIFLSLLLYSHLYYLRKTVRKPLTVKSLNVELGIIIITFLIVQSALGMVKYLY